MAALKSRLKMLIYTTVNCAFSPAFALPWLPRQRFSTTCPDYAEHMAVVFIPA